MAPLIGRESQLELLMGRMAKAMSGEGGLVLISGEAGSGKTALCEEFERLAEKSGCSVLVGRSVPGAQSPYLPFMEAFSDQTTNPFLSGDRTQDPHEGRLLLSVLDGLERLSRERTLILRIEDLHWADSASIALVHFLARNTRVLKVLILGTYRPEDLHPFPSGEPHPLKECLRIMRREGVCQELDTELLGPDDTMKIVPLKLGAAAEEPLLDLVARESRGNPLFAVEMIRFLLTSEQVSYDDGIWTLHLKKGIQTPSTVKEVIRARTSRLPKHAKKALESASVVGERFDPRLVEESVGIHGDRLFDALEMMEKEYNLIREEQGVYVFSHEKVRQVVYDEIPSIRRGELHRRIGEALEKKLPNDELLAQLSWHFREANDTKKCIAYSLLAGNHCYRRKAIREAKAHFLVVLGRTEDDKEHVPERLEALESLGDLKNDASNLREWYSYYERFLELNADRGARARVLAKTAECLDQAGLADTRKAFELLDEAEAISDRDPRVLANVEYRRADMYSNDGRVDDALDHIARARHFFDDFGDRIGVLKCGELQVIVLRQAYRLREAKELAESQLRLARDLGDPERVVMIELLTSFICAMAGETASAKTYATEAIELAGKLGMMWYWRLALHKRACAFELEGDIESAKKDVSRALENAIELENSFHAAMCEIDLGLYESELGNLQKAESHYEAALERVSAFDSWPRSLLESELASLRAELLARIGAFDKSNEVFEGTIERNRELDHPYEMMNCRSRYGIALARRGLNADAQRCFDQAMELAERMGCEMRVRKLARRAGISL